jgi:hypothetical protein
VPPESRTRSAPAPPAACPSNPIILPTRGRALGVEVGSGRPATGIKIRLTEPADADPMAAASLAVPRGERGSEVVLVHVSSSTRGPALGAMAGPLDRSQYTEKNVIVDFGLLNYQRDRDGGCTRDRKTAGHKICWGAWQGTRYWGCGQNCSQSCTSCCAYCGASLSYSNNLGC